MTQVEKQIESQSSFNKDSGGPENKEQNFQAHFNDIDDWRFWNICYGVPHQLSAEESLLL